MFKIHPWSRTTQYANADVMIFLTELQKSSFLDIQKKPNF